MFNKALTRVGLSEQFNIPVLGQHDSVGGATIVFHKLCRTTRCSTARKTESVSVMGHA